MASVKISELPILNELSANNANTVFVAVDKTSNTTVQFPTNILAEGLFANNILNVGTEVASDFPGLIAQFVANTAPYGQVNFQNANTIGSMDVVITADIGDDANNYLDLGVNNSNYEDPAFSSTKAVDGYLIMHGSLGNDYVGNLVLGTAQAETNLLFSIGGTTNLDVFAKMTKYGLAFDNGGYITFNDGSIQSTAALPTAVTLAIQANTIVTQGVDADQNTRMSIIEGVDATQNTVLNNIQTVNIEQNTRMSITEGVDAGQNTRMSIIEGVDVTQNTRLDSIETINNNQNTSISIIQGVDSWQNTEITAVNDYAASGYAKANAALANTTGTFDGSLTITGGLTVTNTINGSNVSIANQIQFTSNARIRTASGNDNEKDIVILTGDEIATDNGGAITIQTGAGTATGRGGDINLIAGLGGLGRGTINLTGNVHADGTSTLNGDFTATGDITSGSGTISTGNLSVGGTTSLVGNVIMNGTATIEGFFNVNNSTFSANTAMMRMTASDNYAVVSPSNSYYMLHITGKSNNVTRVVLDSFGENTYPLLSGRMGRGSAAAPAATANNDVMMRIVGNGYTGTQFPASSPSKIDFVATENFSDTNRGTRIEFWNTPTGSNTIQRIASFNANEAQFTGALNPQKGFIFSPRLPVDDQTAITIDFGSDSIIKASLTQDLTVTLTNYQFGKICELWLVNTGAQNRTVTHGCTALNSTNKSTTYTITSGSSAHLRYFSINGDNANTFVSIIP